MSRAWLDRLAKQLNSSESFDATSGKFYAELLFFKNRSRGSGWKNSLRSKRFRASSSRTSGREQKKKE